MDCMLAGKTVTLQDSHAGHRITDYMGTAPIGSHWLTATIQVNSVQEIQDDRCMQAAPSLAGQDMWVTSDQLPRGLSGD